MKKVLITGASFSIEHIANTLARDNPDIEFTYATTDTSISRFPNLKIVGFNSVYGISLNRNTMSDANSMLSTAWPIRLDGFQQWFAANLPNFDFLIALTLSSQLSNIFESYIIPTLCPTAGCSRLEADKLFTKQVLQEIGVPTPSYRILDKHNLISDMEKESFPIVFKISKHVGATSSFGFGSWVFNDDSFKKIIPMFENADSLMYDRDQEFYVEEFIKGREVSVHFLCNGSDWTYLGASRDYKKIKDGDKGLNTSGVGCYSPVDYFTDDIKDIVCDYATKLLEYISSNAALIFKGVLYLGIIIDENNVPHILEINTRPGSPEVLSILETVDCKDLLNNFSNAARGNTLTPVAPNGLHAVTVCIYHKKYNKDLKFNSQVPDFSDAPADIIVGGSLVIDSGFNFAGTLTASGETREEAANKIYNYLAGKDLKDYTYRTDIGFLE